MNYKEKLIELMGLANKDENTIFIGQQLLFKGNPMSTTLDEVSKDKMIELPVMEETQMGISLGLAMNGHRVITFYPRWDFLLSATNQLINHLDKYVLMSGFQPHIIIRVGKGADKPLDPGHQHKGNYTNEFESMSKTIKYYDCKTILELDIAYKHALENKGIYVICEYPELYLTYTTFNFVINNEEEKVTELDRFIDSRGYNIRDYKICDIKEVEENKQENFFHVAFFNKWLSSYISSNRKLPISDTIKELLIKNKNLYVIFINENEHDGADLFMWLDEIITSEGLSKKQFYIINGNEKLNDINPGEYNSFTSYRLLINTAKNMIHACPSYYFFAEKKYLFMCYNRMDKSHRLLMLASLKKNNLLEDTDWSSLRDYKNCSLSLLLTNEEQKELENEIKFVHDIKIKRSEFEEKLIIDKIEGNGFDWDLSYYNNSFSNSYINIVTESQFQSTLPYNIENQNEVVHITEKSLIPFYYSQIPIIVATYQHKKIMQEKFGFDFFEDLIDYSFDEEINPRKRFQMIMKEIVRLSLIKSEVIDFYKNAEERLRWNKIKVEYIAKSTIENEFFYSLINKKP